MSAEHLSPLLGHRLIIVTGKGGTGKTTVAAGLGVAAARRGLSVLVAEVGGLEQIPGRVSPGHPPVGYATGELIPGLTSIHIDPFEALAEYLGLQTHLRGIVDLVMKNKGFTQLLEAAPGWRELITLGKVWHLAQMRDRRGAHLYELIVVDAPATGHGLTFLDVPRVVFATHVVYQIPREGLLALLDGVAEASRPAPVDFIIMESSGKGDSRVDHFAFEAGERKSRTLLARADSHGRWIEWGGRP
jgi:hypothetical protein